MQLWFYAPHGPWETIEAYKHMYPKIATAKKCGPHMGRSCRLEEYSTMVSAMDGR